MASRFLAATAALVTLASSSCRKADPATESGPSIPWEPVPTELAGAFSGEKAYSHVSRIVSFGPRPPSSEGFEQTLRYLEKQLSSIGWSTRRQSFRAATPDGPVGFSNLIARRSGDTRPAAVVIGGHIDSKKLPFPFVGANDGGSSTGILLELARVLASADRAAEGIEIVFFDGEEAFRQDITPRDGLYGSKYYAHDISTRPHRPRHGIVLDIVGDPEFPLFYNPDAPPAFRKAIAHLGAEIGFPAGFKMAPGLVVDDHIPLQHAGVPCLHLIGDFTTMDYWHRQGDTLDRVTPEMLEKVGRLTLGFLASDALLDPQGGSSGKAEED